MADVFPRLAVAPSEAFTTDFSFLNLVGHKAEDIVGFYGGKEHRGQCQSLAGKKCLNHVFEAMGLCYTERSNPSTSLPAENNEPHGRGNGARRRTGRARKATTGRGTKATAMESRKQKLGGRGRSLAEPANVQIGREIAGKVGNSKKIVIGQTRRFGQV
jgi:hypothetical protein